MSAAPRWGIDGPHDAALHSWAAPASDLATGFPIQNLPFGRFRTGEDAQWRIGLGECRETVRPARR